MKKHAWKWIRLVILIALGCAVYFWASAKLNAMFSWSLPTVTLGDPVMGYTTVEIQDTIAGQSREKSELIVFEQDVQVDSTVDNTFLNLDWFRKSQTMHSYGTAEYTVDLSEVTSDSIQVDESNKIITVSVPHAKLKQVTVDYSKTTFDDVERGVFGWGDIKLTAEQQSVLEQDIQDAMNTECEKESYLKQADDSAETRLVSLFKGFLINLNSDAQIQIVFY